MENRPFEDVFPIENGAFPLLGNHCGSDIFMSEISCYSGCSESEALLGNLLCRRNQVPWPNEWHDEKNMMRYGGNHQWWKERWTPAWKMAIFFVSMLDFWGLKIKRGWGELKSSDSWNVHFTPTTWTIQTLWVFLRIPWQKKTSFSIWHTQVLDWALFATNASIGNLFQWRSVPIICIAVGFKDALRCPGCFGTKRWQLQITNGMLPCQHVCPSSLQGSTTKLEKWTLLILQPWLVLWWVAALECHAWEICLIHHPRAKVQLWLSTTGAWPDALVFRVKGKMVKHSKTSWRK